jgi:uncharacterized protein (TIGR03437 family)
LASPTARTGTSSSPPAWTLNGDYTVRAVIANGLNELRLNGALLGGLAQGFATFTPHPSLPLSAGDIPSWAAGATTYFIAETGLTISSTSGQSATLDFAAAQRPLALEVLAPAPGLSTPWSTATGETWTLTVTFHISPYPDLHALAPFFDRYGQSVQASWPGKIATDDDLRTAAADENTRLDEWGAPSGFDEYGGLLDSGWTRQPTGFYRLAQRNGMWWLVTPAGNPCFYLGADTAPDLTTYTPFSGRQYLFAELPPDAPRAADIWGENNGTAYISFGAVNLLRKYGADWRNLATGNAARRLRVWGFSGIGKWGSDAGGLPILPVLGRWNVPNIARHPDIFDPAVRTTFRNVLASQILPRSTDPKVVGWSLGNEYDEIISAAEIADILNLPATVPARQALYNEALANLYAGNAAAMAAAWLVAPPASDIEHLRRYYATEYYKFVYQTVKDLDPNHLYFGFWIVPGWWENEQDWRLIAPYCDAIGYDRYSDEFADATLDRLMRETAKPVLLGEFSFPATYRLLRGFRAYGTNAVDDAESGTKYARWLQDAWRNPFCVGAAWFEYRDEPVSGRGPGAGPDLVYGEDFAFGLVDVGDRPKWDLVERVRTANLEAARARLAFVLPVLTAAVNAATLAPGPLAPGSLMAVSGTSLDGATLRLGGYDVPTLYTSSTLIYGQVPWDLAGQTTAQLTVSNGNAIDVALAQFAPGLFVALEIGDSVSLYATGLGPVRDNLTVATPIVTVGGVPAEVTFSGLEPEWIGLYRVDFRPPPAASGPLRLQIGGVPSNEKSVSLN